jgi:predicted permease
LIGAGLFARSLRNLLTLDPGFEREGVLLATINPSKHGYKDAQLAGVYEQLLERVRGLGTVRAASLSLMSPITGGGGITLAVTAADGYTPAPGEDGTAFVNAVAPQYFATLGTPLLNGREFSVQDSAGAKVAIIDQAEARYYFRDSNPVGRHITIARQSREIVGVVKDAKYETLRERSHRTVYLPLFENPETWDVVLAVRTDHPSQAAALTAAIRHEVREFGRDIPVETSTLIDAVNETLTQERLVAMLSSFFGLLALLLVSVGLYGVMSYTVTRRTAEIGIRMALGARRADVLWLVLRETLVLLLAGAALGLPAALGAGRLISSMLFGLTPADSVTIVAAVAFLLAVATLAGYLPARRASRIDPMTALRYE